MHFPPVYIYHKSVKGMMKMGLTAASTGKSAVDKNINIEKLSASDKIIALAGNPNVGKSTVFNYLTGMHQHTGNWPGKTVATAYGRYTYNNNGYILVDLPGTYSLLAHSQEEEVARDFICFSKPDVTVVVCDASCLERNLNLVLQTLEITPNVVLCVNLIDEAEKKHIKIDFELLEKMLGIPVIPTSARAGKGMSELIKAVERLSVNPNKSAMRVRYDKDIENRIAEIMDMVGEIDGINKRWLGIRLLENNTSVLSEVREHISEKVLERISEIRSEIPDVSDRIVASIVKTAEKFAVRTVTCGQTNINFDRRLDRILSGKRFGIPIMILMLFFILWLTISGANYPSELLSTLLFSFEDKLVDLSKYVHIPPVIYEPLIFGIYRVLAWVVSVMLPPMAIFFPLFTLLEDFGYLPRVAFNLDKYFKRACTCGKQCLTMCMVSINLYMLYPPFYAYSFINNKYLSDNGADE